LACTGPAVLWTAAKHVLGYTQPMTFYGMRDNIRYFSFDTHAIKMSPAVSVMLGKYEGYAEDAVRTMI